MSSQRLQGKNGLFVACALMALVVLTRLLPHPPNVTAAVAVAIFAGAILPRRLALCLPIIAMMVSDVVLGLHPLILFTWGSLALTTLATSRFLSRIHPLTVAGYSLGASVLFYLVTNFGVWVEGRLYGHTLQGLFASYVNGLPFFRHTVIGDLFFTTLLFSVYALAFRRDMLQSKAGMTAQVR